MKSKRKLEAIIRLKRSKVTWVQLWVTKRCNLVCKHCHSYDNSSTDPSSKEIKERIDRLEDIGVAAIAFYGGEPTLREDLPELVAYARGKGFITYVSTNGNFDKKYLERLGSSGIDIVHSAADYYNEGEIPKEKNRKYLDKSKLDLLLEGRKKYAFNLWLNCCVTPDNKEDLERILHLAKNNEIMVTPHPAMKPIPSEGYNLDDSAFPNQSEMMRLAEFFSSKKREGFPIAAPDSYFKAWKDYAEGKPLEWECRAGEKYFGVGIHGEVIPCCHNLKPFGFGIDDLDYDKMRDHVQRNILPNCNSKCEALTPHCTSYYFKNLIEFVKTFLM